MTAGDRPSRIGSVLVLASAGLLAVACAPTSSSAGSSPSASAAASVAATGSMTPVGPETPSPAIATSTVASTPALTPASTPAAACSPSSIKTLSPGVLTLATSQPAYEPWMVNNDPTNGKGYESAVAYAAAKQLGYTKAEVKWVRADFNQAIQPGAKAFDADINQFSITAARSKVVDFSAPYYDVEQAVVYLKKDAKTAAAAKAGTVAALADLKLGAQVGTTSYDAIGDQIKPSQSAGVYPSNDLAVKALQAGQIDGLVVDLPTALYLAAAELTGGAIAGQLPPAGGKPEQFGMLLPKGSAVTKCLSTALTTLQKNGTLAALEKTWLTSSAGAPVLK